MTFLSPPLPMTVSVSTSGSKGVQQRVGRVSKSGVAVSVSTSGSKGVQLQYTYPRLILMDVSVSTSGSKGVQRVLGFPPTHPFGRFSIHKRIEGGATQSKSFVEDASQTFQYPQADRRGCNWWADRRLAGLAGVSVSTSGSKGVQHESLYSLYYVINVSVSTSGSKGVQQRHVRMATHTSCVSVSTSGSKGVQLEGVHCTNPQNMGFSIHKRIEGGATISITVRIPAAVLFQYPQADRRGCNLIHDGEE